MTIQFLDPKTLFCIEKRKPKETKEYKIVSPSDVVTEDISYMKGHGTYVDEIEIIRSSVLGVVQTVNKLVTVQPIKCRYQGEIGDVVIGRVTEVAQKRWLLDCGSRLDSFLNLSSIHLPGNIQRRKSESDELRMREFYREGDLILIILGSGAISLHTRNINYGKVTPNLVTRSRTQFVKLSCEVDVILGVNGWIWVSKRVPDFTEEDGELIFSDNNIDFNDTEREDLARVGGCINALANNLISINELSVSLAYEYSLSLSLLDLLNVDISNELSNRVLEKVKPN